MKRRMFKTGAIATILGLGLLGCSSGGSEGDAEPVEQVPLEETNEINMLNYQGWMGSGTVAAYNEERGIAVNEHDVPSGGIGGIITLLRQDSGSYDFAMLGSVSAATAEQQGILADFDPSQVPNLDIVPEQFQEAYPWGIPLEQGKVGIIYRTDKVENPPQSWEELFERMPEFSGRVAFPDYDMDVFAMAHLAMGVDINTPELELYDEAAEMIMEAKPHVKAFLSSDRVRALKDGSVDIAIGYDYDTAGVLGVDEEIGWIAPSEGVPAYLDGWLTFADSEHQPAVYDFMNFGLDLEQYADFINTTGAAYIIPEVEPLLDPSILENEALKLDLDVDVHYELFVNGEVHAKRAELWEQIMAS